MKKVILTIISASILGCLFAYFIFNNTNKKEVKAMELKDNGYAFQVGVYHDYNNALNEANKYPSGTVITDGEFNRVYIGLASNKETLNTLKDYYNKNNINYFMRRIEIPSEFTEKFYMYEQVLNNTDDIDSINKQFLKEYSDSLYEVYN